MSNEEQLRYPFGRFTPKDNYSAVDIQNLIGKIEALPQEVEKIVNSLTAKQLDTRYRDDGWTARQVVHHLADSHMNAYIRTKWALTEEIPIIKAYDEKAWAETPDTKLDPSLSIALLKTLHAKWAALLRQLGPKDFMREFIHPVTQKHTPMDRNIALYAWHGEHHCAHLRIVANMKS